jgi:hypothetical protein
MSNLLQEIQYDLNFIRSHTLQPRWYKALKVFVVGGFLLAYATYFGGKKTGVFMAVFFFLSFLVHMLYRVKTDRWKRSWLDFVVVEEDQEIRPKSIGKFYYAAVALNTVIALVISLLLAG